MRAGATNHAGGVGMAQRVTELLQRSMLATVEEGTASLVPCGRQGPDCFEFACRLVQLQVQHKHEPYTLTSTLHP